MKPQWISYQTNCRSLNLNHKGSYRKWGYTNYVGCKNLVLISFKNNTSRNNVRALLKNIINPTVQKDKDKAFYQVTLQEIKNVNLNLNLNSKSFETCFKALLNYLQNNTTEQLLKACCRSINTNRKL